MRIKLLILNIWLTISCVYAAQWKTHLAYNDLQQIVVGAEEVYVLSNGNIYSVNKQTEQKHFYTLQDGFVTSGCSYIFYDDSRDELLLFYDNGYADVKSANGVHAISSLYLSQTTLAKKVHTAERKDNMLYLGMPYGVQTYDLQTRTFVDSYFLGPEGAELPIYHLAFLGRDLYAATDSLIYYAGIADQPVDYRNWQALPPMEGMAIRGIAVSQGRLYALWDDHLYRYQNNAWTLAMQQSVTGLLNSKNHVFALVASGGFYDLTQSASELIAPHQHPVTVAYDNVHHDYWYADNEQGLTHGALTGEVAYPLSTPAVNHPTRMYYGRDKLFVVPGDRWAIQASRPGCIMMYENGAWTNVSHADLCAQAGTNVTDLMSVAVDPQDDNHYFVGAYGKGIFEMQGAEMLNHFDATNSSLYDASQIAPLDYTRVDGIQFDSHQNLWFTQGNQHISCKLANRSFTDSLLHFPLVGTNRMIVSLGTASNLVLDEERNQMWVGQCRSTTGLGLYFHNGTLSNTADDRALFRSVFILDDGTPANFEYLYWIAEDKDKNVWLCTTSGLYYFAADDDFFTSNVLHHLGVMEGDADYFLKNESTTCMAVDAQNRKWVGTKRLGVYLLSADNQQVLAHFTTANSALPANNVLSIAIHPQTGAVMIGTSAGMAEYNEHDTRLTEEDLSYLETDEFSGAMHGWTFHYAYTDVHEIARLGNMIYGLAGGTLFSLDTETEEVRSVNSLNGLSSAGIGHIVGDGDGRMLVAYQDGNMDIFYQDGRVVNLTDLKRKQMPGVSKLFNNACYHNHKMYLAMPFGVLVLNMTKAEFSDWYQPTLNYTDLQRVTVIGDSLYAVSASTLYVANLKDNLSDYSQWQAYPIASRPDIDVPGSLMQELHVNGCTYYAAGDKGIRRLCGGTETTYVPSGPACNTPYRITPSQNMLYMVPGGRWSAEFARPANIMRYSEGEWHNTTFTSLLEQYNRRGFIGDFTRVAVDPLRDNHYAVSSYGFGLFMMNGDQIEHVYHEENSPLVSAIGAGKPLSGNYVRVEGVTYDANGYLWMLNSTNQKAMQVLSPEGQWASLPVRSGATSLTFDVPGDVLNDALRPHYHWLVSARSPAGVGLLDDGGTPLDPSDDRSAFYSNFVDQNGKPVAPEAVYSIAQDKVGNIWVGTNAGVLLLSYTTDFFQTNRCSRIIIRREDGSDLGDYMLGTERINGIAVDGGNRLWFATGSGAYLMDIDLSSEGNHKTVYHFTTSNSPLPANNVISVAILPESGEVFFGTEEGLVSFRSDASEGREDYSAAYAFPNPVRPDYQGMLTVSNLVEHSAVKITDAAGRTVYSAMSNGGTVVWNMKDANGRRVTPGVYTIFLNSTSSDPSQHAAVKVLIM